MLQCVHVQAYLRRVRILLLRGCNADGCVPVPSVGKLIRGMGYLSAHHSMRNVLQGPMNFASLQASEDQARQEYGLLNEVEYVSEFQTLLS